MKSKKLLAILLSLAMLIGLMPVAGLVLGGAAEGAVCTVYVSDSGDDAAAGTSAGAPFKTLLKAVQTIEASDADSGVINVVGTVTTGNAFAMTTATGIGDLTQMHAVPITIQGNAGTESKLVISESGGDYDLFLYGDITFDNIALEVSDSCIIFTNKHDLTFGSNVVMNKAPSVFFGYYNANNGKTGLVVPTEPTNFTANVGTYDILQLGGRFTHNTSNAKSGVMAGANVLLNGGTVKRVYVGHLSRSTFTAGITYTKDVNVTVNGGGLQKLYVGDFSVAHTVPTTLSGNALQLILNNGAAMPTVEYSPYLSDTSSLKAAVTAMNGELYVLQSAAGGSTLTATAEAGTYTVVNPTYTAIATDVTDATKIYRSANGVLTVPAGTYTVTWETPDTLNVYVGDNGADTNSGLSADAPFKTLLKAVQTIAGSGAKEGVINVVGTVTTGGAYAMTTATGIDNLTQMHAMPIAIRGNEGTASTLTISEKSGDYDLFLYGDITIDNITVNASENCTIITNKHDFAFGPNAVVNNKPTIFLGHYNANNIRPGLVVPTEPTNLTLSAGNYTAVGLGGTLTNKSNAKCGVMAGVNLLLNGATVKSLRVGHGGRGSYVGGNIYKGDVNVTVNSGSITELMVGDYGVEHTDSPTTLSDNALQLILNNGAAMPTVKYSPYLADTSSLKAAVTAMNGKLFVMQCLEGISLSATAEEGVYNVVAPDKDVVAIDVDDNTKTYQSVDGVLTVPAGNYRVGHKVIENYAVYVSDSGNDDNVGTSADAPFKTLLKAVQAIEASGAKAGSIKVVGNVTVDSAFAMTTATTIADLTQMHSMPITIEGNEGKESTFTINDNAGDYDLFLYGDIAFDNITLDASAGCSIYTNKHDLTFGQNVAMDNVPNVWLSHYNANNNRPGLVVPTEPTVLTLNGCTFDIVQLGGRLVHITSNAKAGVMAGAELRLNAGTVKRLYVGHLGRGDFTAGITYTKDVNVTVNGGELQKLYVGDFGVAHTVPTTLSGNALQLILNDGAAMPKVECSPYLTDTSSLAAAVTSMNGKLYVLQCAEDVFLTATDEAGVYTVKSDYDVIAVCKETGERISAVNGVLTLPAAGTYAVGDGEDVDFDDDGMIPLDAVWKVDYPALNSDATMNALWTNLGELEVGEEYTFSFDYYYESGDRLMIHDATRWGVSDNPITWGDRDKWIYPDKATMTKTFVATHKKFYPGFEQPAGSSCGALYIWNFSLVKTGTTKNLYERADLTYNRDDNPAPFVYMVDVDPDTFVDPIVPGVGDDANGDGIVSANEATGPIEDNVYRYNFSKYDWEENDYKTYKLRMAYITFPEGVKEGMDLTLSFDWCVQTNCFAYIYNPYATWGSYKENPGTQYSEIEGTRTEFWGPDKGSFTFSFTTNENDVKNGGGKRMAFAIEASQNYGKSDIYFWNLKLTEKGSDVNLLTYNTFVWNDDDMLEVVDIDPNTIEMFETVFEEEDKFDDSIDMDTGDVDIEDDSEPLIDLDTQISLEYEDGSAFGADEFLSIYPYADGELQQEILDIIGDNKYIAYDIGLALGDEFIEPSGTMKVGIPIPDDFDAEQVFLYGTDEFGHLYAIDFENVYGIAYFTTDVLGTFVLVEGELTLPEYPEEGEQEPTDEPVDDNEPTDEPVDAEPDNKDDKDDKKDKNKKDDDKSNGWLLWVIIGGGVLLLAAAGVTVFFVLKKKKGAKADAE